MTGNASTRAVGMSAANEPKSPTPMGGASVSEVLARLEAAECGSRELDAEVASVCEDGEVVWIQNRYIEGSNPAIRRPSANHLGGFVNDPCYSYTTSLDAALALAERIWPHVMWRVGHDPDDGSFKAQLATAQKPGDQPAVHANASTSALALCIAILRARQASNPTAEGV